MLDRLREGEVERAGFFGVRERDGREVRIGLDLCGHRNERRESCPNEEIWHDRAADSVHRRVHAREFALRGRREQRDRQLRVGVQKRVLVDAHDARRRVWRKRFDRRRAEMCAQFGDALVVGRDDLRAIGRVDLVAVVRRGVVARCNHHTGRRLKVANCEGDDRCRQMMREAVNVHARRGRDLDGVVGE